MSRKLMTILLSSALVLGNVSTSAWAANDAPGAVQAQTTQQNTDAASNQPPLPPAGAAGIQQAQGIENSPWLGIGLVVAIVAIAWILLDDDDEDDDDSSPGT
jgi:hypothetical protein